jgi:CBS domain containing-hemolysin-like protein
MPGNWHRISRCPPGDDPGIKAIDLARPTHDPPGAQQHKPHLISAEELKTIASLSRKSGEIEAGQETVIANILQLGHKTVRQVMTPRTVTFSASQALTIKEAARMEGKWQMHSRVPVYDGEQDNVVGIVLSQDVLMAAAVGQDSLKLSQIMRPVHFVPETAASRPNFHRFFRALPASLCGGRRIRQRDRRDQHGGHP